jgi:hypothetical protein
MYVYTSLNIIAGEFALVRSAAADQTVTLGREPICVINLVDELVAS